MKKIILFYLLLSALVNAETTIKLDSSVIKGKNLEREFFAAPKEIKNTYVVTQEEIQERNYKNVEDILRDSPSVIVNNTAFGPRVDMRGSGEKSLSRVKVLVDGVSINPTEETMASLPINSIPIESIKKVEIIPGGGATLYGSGSVGGVISILTNSNVTKDNFFMDLKYASFDSRNFGFAGGKNVTDKLYLNYGFNYVNSEGYRESEENENTIFLGGFDYKFNDKNKIRFQARTGKEKLNGTNQISKDILTYNRKASGLNLDIITKNDSYTFDYENRLTDNITLASTFFYQKQDRDIKTESIDDINITVSDRKYTDKKTELIFSDVKSLMNAKFSEEKYGIKLKSNFDYGVGNLILGYDYYNSNNIRKSEVKTETLKEYYSSGSYMNLSPDDRKPVTNVVNIDLTKESHGLYLFNKYDYTENLTFTSGIRGEYTKYSGSRKNGPNVMPMIEPKVQEIHTDEKLENYAGEVGALYQYRDTGNTFLRYERGFVTPFATQLTDKIHDTKLKNPDSGIMIPPVVNVASIYVANNLKAETTDTVEFGINDYIWNSLFSASFYVTDTKDEITLIESGVTNPAIKRWKYRNIGKTRRMGVELQTEQYFEKLSLSQSLSYVDARVLNGESSLKINKDDKIPMVPKLKATFGAKYSITPKFALLGNYTYTGKKEARELDENDNINKFEIDGYGTVDLSLLYSIDEYSSLKVGVKNLTSKKYNLRETSKEAFPAPERNYFVELNVKF